MNYCLDIYVYLMFLLSFYFQVNSKVTLMFSGLLSDEVHENIFCPDLPYVTDEHGSKFRYFQVATMMSSDLSCDWYLHLL